MPPAKRVVMTQNGVCRLFQKRFQNLQHPVLPVRRAGVFCRGNDFRSGVGDGVAFAGVLKHLDVVQVVAEAADFVWGKAEVVHQK